MIPPVKPYMRAWISGLAAKVAGVIGWGPTLKAVKAGIEYEKENPFPRDPSKPVTGNPATETQPPAPKPPTTVDWTARMKRQMLFFSAPNYYWPEVTPAEIDRTLDAVLAAGMDGISVELGGMYIADEYNHVQNHATVASIFDKRLTQWDPWEAGLRARGLVAHIAFLNSNSSGNNESPDSWWREYAKTFIRRHGGANKLILPLSERDSRTRASIGQAICDGLRDAGLPREQIISYGGSSWGAYTETHQGRNSIERGSQTVITVNDNGPAIADLYGGDWRNGGKPNIANIEDYARRVRAAGVSGAVYSFGRTFDYAGCAAAGHGWIGATADTPPPAAQDAIPIDMLKPPRSEQAWRAWPIVCTIEKIERVGDDSIKATFAPRPDWNKTGSKGINGNWSIFDANGNGGTWEYTVTTDKARDKRECGKIRGAAPGSVWYFVLTAVCRNGERNGSQGRSQVFKWVAP